MADAPYLIVLALLEQGGERAMPLQGKSLREPLPAPGPALIRTSLPWRVSNRRRSSWISWVCHCRGCRLLSGRGSTAAGTAAMAGARLGTRRSNDSDRMPPLCGDSSKKVGHFYLFASALDALTSGHHPLPGFAPFAHG